MTYYETFTLTEQHVKLLRKMYCDFDDNSYDGAPAINIKRPYGNSFVAGDVAEILGEPFDDDEEDMVEEDVERFMAIHRETGTALQVCLSTLSFEPGLYGRPMKYDTQKWVKVKDDGNN